MQLFAKQTFRNGRTGSNPVSPAKVFAAVAQWIRAVGFYPIGQGFESSRRRQIAKMVELEYTQHLKCCAYRLEGSSPSLRTTIYFYVFLLYNIIVD